jgi:hypothetical protein
MLEIIDYSSRRGAIVPLLPKVHALLKELSEKERLCGLEPPENWVTWRQKMNPLLLDVQRRYLFAIDVEKPDKREVLGYLFYRCSPQEADRLYIDDMQIAWAHGINPAVAEGLINKLQNDPRAKAAMFFGSERLRKMADKEILAGVGFKEHFPDGWEPLGNVREAMGALKLRYGRVKV